MITDVGSLIVGRTLADNLGTHIAVGVGESVPSVGDTGLDFEVFRMPVRVRSYDPQSNTVVLAATMPESLDVVVSEVALLQSSSNAGSFGILENFSETSEWVNGSHETANMRIGGGGLRVSQEEASVSENSFGASSDLQNSGSVEVAYFGEGGDVEVRLKTGSTDYYSFSFTAEAGYNVYSVPVYNLAVTGEPMLNSINSMSVTHSGTGAVVLDAIRAKADYDDESVIIRQVFNQPFQKIEGMPTDVEISVVVPS